MLKDLTRFTKNSQIVKRCKVWPFRLLYSNREFDKGQYAAPKRRGSSAGAGSGVPEPLETVLMVPGAVFSIPIRPRRFLDLPGDNTVRGLSNVPMKGEYQYKLMTTLRTKKAILKGMPHQSSLSAGSNEDLGGVLSLLDDEEAPDTQDAEALTVEDSDAVPLFPWEPSEKLFREYIQMYAAKPPAGAGGYAATIVDLSPGQCSAALACARECITYIGLVRTSLHASVIRQTSLAMIMSELVDQALLGRVYFLCVFVWGGRAIGVSFFFSGGRAIWRFVAAGVKRCMTASSAGAS